MSKLPSPEEGWILFCNLCGETWGKHSPTCALATPPRPGAEVIDLSVERQKRLKPKR
jgi:hypothetical protein